MKPRVLAGTAVLVMLSAVACNRTQTTQEAERTAEQVKGAAAQAGEKLADGWLTAKIQAQFFADDDVKSRYINVIRTRRRREAEGIRRERRRPAPGPGDRQKHRRRHTDR